VNFHHQLHNQFESSTPAKKKTINEDPSGVGPEGEAPMLKLAKKIFIFPQLREISSRFLCVLGSGDLVGFI
jgi:hypothetical protein